MGNYRLAYMLYTFYHNAYKIVQNIPREEKLQFNEINSDFTNAILYKNLRLPPTKQENRQHSELYSNVYVVFVDICQA